MTTYRLTVTRQVLEGAWKPGQRTYRVLQGVPDEAKLRVIQEVPDGLLLYYEVEDGSDETEEAQVTERAYYLDLDEATHVMSSLDWAPDKGWYCPHCGQSLVFGEGDR